MPRLAKTFSLLIVAALAGACDSGLPLRPTTTVADSSAADSTGNHRPIAIILGTTLTAEGIDADFSALRSSDADGDSLTYWWDFGDGSTRSGAGTERHTYADNGDYVVTLVVSDSHHAADTATQALSIYNRVPYLDSLSFSVASSPAPLPVAATLTFQVTDGGINDNPVAMVDWGDGNVSQLKTHTYTAPGAYSIAITVTDKDGGADSTRLPETVWVYDAGHTPSTAPNYEAIDLSSLGGNQTVPTALNNRGDVVGYGVPGHVEDDPRAGWPLQHAFLWSNGVITDINPGFPKSSAAQSINDAGSIAGAVWDFSSSSMATWQNASLQSITSTGSDENRVEAVAVNGAGDVALNIAGHEYPKAYVWSNGALQNLGGLGSSHYTWAQDRNAHGQIVGTSVLRFLMTQSDEDRAFVWENGVMNGLGVLGTYPCDSAGSYPSQCGYSAAVDINDQGEIVGTSRTAAAIDRAVRWDVGSVAPQDLGFGSGRSRAVAINGRGQIVGDSYGEGDAYFRDSDGSITPIGSLGGGHTQVVAMNNSGTVVGFSVTAAGDVHAFVWQLGLGMSDLGAGPFGARGVSSIPVAINDGGDVIGWASPCRTAATYGCHPLGTVRGVLWRTQALSSGAAR